MKKVISFAVALALPGMLFVAMAMADAPASTPSGVQPATPAVPGGGNDNAKSDHAATPAVPAQPAVRAEMPGPGDMQPDEVGAFSDKNPVLGGEAKAKWEAMTPDEKKAFIKDHPKLRRMMMKKQWEKMTPAERGAFLDAHPELKEKMKARWEAMTPEERQAFLASHPKIEKRWKKQHAQGHPRDMKDRDMKGGDDMKGDDDKGGKMDNHPGGRPAGAGDNGVRDHGQGMGRDGAGQGKGQGMGHGRK